MTTRIPVAVPLLLLSLLLAPPTWGAKNVVFVIDASASMRTALEGQTRFDAVRDALQDLIKTLPATGINAGLYVYGGRRERDCKDIERVVALAPLDRAALLAGISAIRTRGATPIATALEAAADELSAAAGEKAIILLTDGKETCNRDPAEVAQRLHAQRGIAVHVVGFDILKPEEAMVLRRIADLAGGGYYTASTAEGLREAIGRAAKSVETGSVVADGKVQENTQIILDRSSDMESPFTDTTRLDVARRALTSVLGRQHADRDNLAYRHFGGACDGTASELVVGFSLNNGPIIRESVKQVKTRGQRTLVDAVINAAYDFDDPARFEGVNKSVLIITGGTDECFRRQGAEIVRERLANRKIKPEYEIVGVGITARDLAELQSLAEALGGRAYAVVNEQQLEQLLERMLELNPVIRNLESIVQTVNESIAYLDRSGQGIQARNLAVARENAAKARSLVADTTIPYRDLARRRASETLAQIFAVSKDLRELQVQMVNTRVHQIGELESGDVRGLDRAVAAYEALTRDYNRLAVKGNALLKQVKQR